MHVMDIDPHAGDVYVIGEYNYRVIYPKGNGEPIQYEDDLVYNLNHQISPLIQYTAGCS
jgi:hypothetical protein